VSLRERNTIGMVAEHWGVSTRTVRRLVDSGALPVLRIGGAVRLTRQAIEVYESQCTSSGSTETGSGTSSTAPALRRRVSTRTKEPPRG
jgi:excisionase family DNA binding protein